MPNQRVPVGPLSLLQSESCPSFSSVSPWWRMGWLGGLGGLWGGGEKCGRVSPVVVVYMGSWVVLGVPWGLWVRFLSLQRSCYALREGGGDSHSLW